MTAHSDKWSLDQIRAKQTEFLQALESEVKNRPGTPIDPVAVGQQVGLDSILTTEFIVYWVNMGRLDRAWLKIADKLREQWADTPLKPPPGMIADSSPKIKPGKVYSEEQRRVYAELWQDIMNIAKEKTVIGIRPKYGGGIDREIIAAYHNMQRQVGYDGIKKVDSLAPYLEEEHYHLLRDYFNIYANYHMSRESSSLNPKLQDPNKWTEEENMLRKQLFHSGLVEIETIFRDVLTTQGEQQPLIIAQGGEIIMSKTGDTYNVGQAGAVGPKAYAHDMTFTQIGSQIENSMDLLQLADELSKLRQAMKNEATEIEHDIAISDIAKAEQAAREKDTPKVAEYLKSAGKWALEIGTKIGITLATDALKRAIGL